VNVLLGDADTMRDYAMGGADSVTGGSAGGNGDSQFAMNFMSGDAQDLIGQAVGGKDFLQGGDGYFGQTFNAMAGDAFSASGAVKFGADTLVGGDGYVPFSGPAVVNVMAGDVMDFDPFQFTNPFLLSTGAGPLDSFDLPNPGVHSGKLLYAGDTLMGGNGYAINFMVGDASTLYSGDVGGNDTIIGGNGAQNTLIGDSLWNDGGIGGKDTLVSAAFTNDEMYGDTYYDNYGLGGADKFVFQQGNGNDVIYDFRQYEGDKIDLTAFRGLAEFKNFNTLMASGRVDSTYEGTLLQLDPGYADSGSNTVLLAGVNPWDLSASSFIF
jgi:hypothetical protein